MIAVVYAEERMIFKMNLRRRKTIKVLICVLSLLFVLFALVGCGEKASEKDGNNEKPTSSDSQPEDILYQIGETGSTDELEIMITKVEKAAEWINGPSQGREYVVVSFKVTNISEEEQSIGADDFQYIIDENGDRESYARTTGVKADPDTFGGESIAPRESFEGSLVYAMPVEMSHIELHYIEGYNINPALKFGFDK